MLAFEEKMQRGSTPAVQEAARFFMRDDPVHHTLRGITERLDGVGIPYAVAGGMALVAHGYNRTTADVGVLVTADGLKSLQQALEGLGYLPAFSGSKNLHDTQTGVRIEFLVTGGFPGDGKPKPVSFPDPSTASAEIDGIRYLNLPSLIELKLASGMTNPGRLKDLADVQELIRLLNLSAEYAETLNPFVRDQFVELWVGVRNSHDNCDH